MTERRALILRGNDEAEVVRRANDLLETGDYEMLMKPLAVSAVHGAGPLMMILLEEADGSGSRRVN